MEDKELDQMLKKALIPNIKDNETKIRFEMEDCVMRKQKNFKTCNCIGSLCSIGHWAFIWKCHRKNYRHAYVIIGV